MVLARIHQIDIGCVGESSAVDAHLSIRRRHQPDLKALDIQILIVVFSQVVDVADVHAGFTDLIRSIQHSDITQINIDVVIHQNAVG